MTIVVAITAVLMTAVVLRLLSGPVDLEVARPFLPTEFDTPAGPVRVKAEHIYAEWSGLKEPMRLVLTGLHLTAGAIVIPTLVSRLAIIG